MPKYYTVEEAKAELRITLSERTLRRKIKTILGIKGHRGQLLITEDELEQVRPCKPSFVRFTAR